MSLVKVLTKSTKILEAGLYYKTAFSSKDLIVLLALGDFCKQKIFSKIQNTGPNEMV